MTTWLRLLVSLTLSAVTPALSMQRPMAAPAYGQTSTAMKPLPDAIPAFPGAWGGGMFATGGRGGKVIAVVNLNDDGPGSLREAVSTPGPRIVVFRVSGTIDLQSDLVVAHSNLTIAGQTAPGDGICLKRFPLKVDGANDVVARFLCVRPGDESGRRHGGIEVRQAANVILDHCSVSWSIDEAVNGNCLLQSFTYGELAGPLSLAPGTYNIKIGLADSENRCSNPPVIEADLPFADGEVAVVIAHLDADGAPTASKFLLDPSATEEGRSRISLHHTAAAPAADILLQGTVCNWQGQRRFDAVPNGAQGALTVPPGNWEISLLPAGSDTPVLGPQRLAVDSSQSYLIFAVGSLGNDSLTLLMYDGALEGDATFGLIPAVVYVIHGIPGQGLGLPADLPVDIALNGTCALTAFTFGTVTDPIELAPGVYNLKIGLANADNPSSEPAVIEADVKLAAQDNLTIIAHLTEHAQPTASVFSNTLADCTKDIDSALLVHHTAAAPAVDIRAEVKNGLWLPGLDPRGCDQRCSRTADHLAGGVERVDFAGRHEVPCLWTGRTRVEFGTGVLPVRRRFSGQWHLHRAPEHDPSGPHDRRHGH